MDNIRDNLNNIRVMLSLIATDIGNEIDSIQEIEDNLSDTSPDIAELKTESNKYSSIVKDIEKNKEMIENITANVRDLVFGYE